MLRGCAVEFAPGVRFGILCRECVRKYICRGCDSGGFVRVVVANSVWAVGVLCIMCFFDLAPFYVVFVRWNV